MTEALLRWSDQKKMADWLNRELDRIMNDEFIARRPSPPDVAKRHIAWVKTLGPEIEHAEHGDIEPLRRRLPHLAKFLHLPGRGGKGKRFPKLTKYSADPVGDAAADVGRIRALWKKHHGKWKRRRDEISAEQFAADRWEVDVDLVHQRMKKLPAK